MRYRRTFIVLLLIVIAAGSLLRIKAARKWEELDGDVNLFALTAREFARNSRLFYPVKYEYRQEVPYKELASPATQHPPLFPFLAGILAKIVGTSDTFACMKVLNCAGGIALLALAAWLAFQLGNYGAPLLAVALCATSPALIFYSINGSVYILLACINIGVLCILARLPSLSLLHGALLGLLCGVGILLHSCMAALIAAVVLTLLIARKSVAWRHVALGCAAFAIVMTPYMAWNYYYLGKFFPSYSSTYFLIIHGMAKARLLGEEVLYRPLDLPFSEVVLKVSRNFIIAAGQYARNIWDTLGPGALLLIPAGLWHLWKTRRSLFYATASMILFQFIISCMVGLYRQRFSIPIIPVLFLLTGLGFAALISQRWWWKAAAGLLGLVALAQQATLLYLDGGKSYTQASARRQYTYAKMLKMVNRMRDELPPGLVLGAAKMGDGGLETAYWLDWPYVHGREMYGPVITPKLAKDFDAKYVWCDKNNARLVQKWMPDYKPAMSNEYYVVLSKTDDVATATQTIN